MKIWRRLDVTNASLRPGQAGRQLADRASDAQTADPLVTALRGSDKRKRARLLNHTLQAGGRIL